MDMILIDGFLAIYFFLNTVILIRAIKHLRKKQQYSMRNHLALAWITFFGTLGYCVYCGQRAMALIRAMEQNSQAPYAKGEEAYSQDRFKYQWCRSDRYDGLDV